MAGTDDILKRFTTRTRQLILQYEQTRRENEELYAMLDSQEKEVKRLNEALEQQKQAYERLRMAKMMEISDGDLEAARSRFARLIREINKCITLLSER